MRRSAANSRPPEVEDPEVGLRNIDAAQRVRDQDVDDAVDVEDGLVDGLDGPQRAGGAEEPAAVGVVGLGVETARRIGSALVTVIVAGPRSAKYTAA